MSAENDKKEKKINYFLILTIFSVIALLSSSFYNFYLNKNYHFIVETSCDSTKEICFYRDCSLEDSECPPNNFSYYKKYTISAKDFPLCENEDCTRACAVGNIYCQEEKCTLANIAEGVCQLPSVENEQ